MALANISVLLAQWGHKVLVVDWDLEAPGLEHYFVPFINSTVVAHREGVLDFLQQSSASDATRAVEAWRSLALPIPIPRTKGSLDIIGSGQRNTDYFIRLRSLDVGSFYTERGGGLLIERLRAEWKDAYDYVLLDSRTGITDIGGICTIHLPDVLVLLFTATEQSLAGVVDVANRANEQRQKLPFDRMSLSCLPLPSKFDTITERQVSQKWLDRFVSELTPLYAEWLPKEVDTRKFLESTKIPYVSYFSFGEKLAVCEQGTSDPAGLGYAYESVAALIANDLVNPSDILGDRERYLRAAATPRIKPRSGTRKGEELALLLIEPYSTEALSRLASGRTGWSLMIEEQLIPIVEAHYGEMTPATDTTYLCRFHRIIHALQCGLRVQQRFALNPIRSQGETLKARMGLHGVSSDEANNPRTLTTAASLLGNAKAGQLIVSEVVYRSCFQQVDGVRFKAAGTIELSEIPDDLVVVTYEAIGIRKIRLNVDERARLFEQDPASRNSGGFQNFLVKLQEKTNRTTGELELTTSDLERIARLAFDYRHGGWQNQLRRIFGRVLGDTLGRDAKY